MFQIKICGVTTPADAQAATAAGADMIGLNFYAGSSRYIAPEVAKTIAEVTPNVTGVFVNSTAEQINRIATEVGLNWIQLHGDEPPSLLSVLPSDLPIIRARTLDERGLAAIADDLEACRAQGRAPDAILIDATVPGEYGGTGQVADWPALDNYQNWLGETPLILAGGLTPANVAAAIHAVAPAAVDTASGVETSPGVKDVEKMQLFTSAAKAVLASLAD